MTGSKIGREPHIDEGDLIRLLDGECSSEESQRFGAHIDACPECRSNAESLRKASELFSNSLLELDSDAPATPKRELTFGKRIKRDRAWLSVVSPRVLRAAAALALMVLVFTATPARAWLVQGWRSLKSLVVSDPVYQPEASDVPEDPPLDMSSVLRFTPRGAEFRLEFTEYQTRGLLTLLIDSTTYASAGTIGQDVGEEMILLPNGLRVRNSSSSLTSYEVNLPLTLSLVEVSVAGNTILRLDVQSQPTPLSRELSLTAGNRN